MFDIEMILDEFSIDYAKSGKNIGANDINISCPFCDGDLHLGINVTNGMTHCWVCRFESEDKWPSLQKILVKISGENWQTVKAVMEEHGWEDNYTSAEEANNKPAEKCYLPTGSRSYSTGSTYWTEAFEYLRLRGYGEEEIRDYGIQVCTNQSLAYGGRLIIPVYLNYKLVSFVARDYTGEQDRYKNCSLFNSVLRLKDTLYNYDNASQFKHGYLLEGATDVWRMGFDSMGVFKSALSPRQRNLIIKAEFDSLTIVFDPQATSRAYLAASELAPFIRSIKVVRLDGIKDVGERTRNEIKEVEDGTKEFRA